MIQTFNDLQIIRDLMKSRSFLWLERVLFVNPREKVFIYSFIERQYLKVRL